MEPTVSQKVIEIIEKIDCVGCRGTIKLACRIPMANNESNRWAMYGCVCDPAQAEGAQAFIDLVSR